MSYLSDDVEEMEDILVDVTDDLVYHNQTILPEDMFFIAHLLEEYYKSKAHEEFGNKQACDIAWVFAQELAGFVSKDDEFDWFNAYFVCNGLYESVRQDFIEFQSRSWDADAPIEHFNSFGRTQQPERIHTESVEGFDEALNDIREVLELYVDLSTESAEDEEELGKAQQIAMFVSVLQNRYAHEFPYDMLESGVSFELVPLLTTLTTDETVSERAVYDGLRYVRDWAEQRAKREHEMLCVGVDCE